MYKISGTVVHVGETVQVSEKFRTRQLVVRVDGMYPKEIELKAIQHKCEELDSLKAFEEIEVSFDIDGKKYEKKEGGFGWFNSLIVLNVLKI